MHKIILILFLITGLLFAEDDQVSYVTSERDSLAIVDGLVNVCNGKLIQIDKDIEIQGSSPLELTRYYDGGHHFESDFGYGIGISLPIKIKYYPQLEEKNNFFPEQRTGSYIPCDAKSEKKNKAGGVSKEFISTSHTNYTESVLRGEPPLTALSFKCVLSGSTIKLGDGTIRYYDLYDCKRFIELTQGGYPAKKQPVYHRLTAEKLPNGNVRHIKYGNGNPILPSRIYTVNSDGSLELNAIDLSYKFIRKGEDNKSEFLVTMKASNGQQVSYYTKKERGKDQKGDKRHYYLLEKVIGSHLPTSEYCSLMRTKRLSSLFSFNKIKRPDGRFLEVEYDEKERVKNLFMSGISTPLYTFSYGSKYKLVTNGLGAVKKYEFSKNRLKKVEDENSAQQFVWDTKGQLKAHTVTDKDGNELSKKTYKYDCKGNILESRLYGNIKEVGSKDEYTIKFTYSNDHFNLVLSELHNDKKEITYRYKPETNLLEEKLTIVDDKIVEREFYTYDKNAILIKKITDDGDDNGFRLITTIEPYLDPNLPGMTLPHITRQYYEDLGQYRPLKTIEHFYTNGGLISEERVFDSFGKLQKTSLFEYNEKRQLVSETNALGEKTIYSYDANGNKIFEELIGTGKKTLFEYNEANQLVLESEQHSDKIKSTKTYAYDAMGNITSSTDEFEQETTFTFDKNSRETERTDPLGQTEYKEYDALNRITAQIDKDGCRTETISNIHGKPLEEKYPDGTSKKFTYNLEGYLTREVERDGNTHIYELDYQGRVLIKKTFCPQGNIIKTLQYTYQGPNLTSETDDMGNVKEYTYDGAGRKISQKMGDISTYYEYDSLGRLYKTTCSDRVDVKEYDLLDRVIETRVEDNADQVYQKTEYSYDIFGNVISERIFSDQDTYSEYIKLFNSRNLLALQIDPLGNETKIEYSYTDHLKKETTDPMGRKKKEIFDPLQRLLVVEHNDANKNQLAHTSFEYDGRDHITKQHEKSLFQDLDFGLYKIDFTYDCMGQKILEDEQGAKKTAYTYKFDKLYTITKPDNVILYHTYDSLGRLIELESSEGTIHYKYSYDQNDNLLTAKDLINETVTERTYDDLNRLTYEKQATGLAFIYKYDDLDRIKELEFFDGKIIYNYSPTALTSIVREKNDQIIYAYQRETDWCGKTVYEKLPNDCAVSYVWDQLGRCEEINSNHFNQTFEYNPVGNLINTSVQDPLGSYSSNFAYDDLNQITEESGLFENIYAFDSNNNRREKNGSKYSIDGLNQLTDDESYKYTYDKNGRRISKGNDSYSYDALGRLISFNNTTYCYDPLGRRTDRHDQNSTQYFYLQDTEIGLCQNGYIREFRAIYNEHKTAFIELDQIVYCPIRNHRGDICVLLDDQQVPQAIYRYDAFGEFKYQGSISSPWLFSSQRYDEITNLYHFAKREYDPSSGRWLVPDPLGFADGPNLYAYVHNNPFTHIDPYGLYDKELFDRDCNSALKGVGTGAKNVFINPFSTGSRYCHYGSVLFNSIKSNDYSSITSRWNSMDGENKIQFVTQHATEIGVSAYASYRIIGQGILNSLGYAAKWACNKIVNNTITKVSDVARRSGVDASKDGLSSIVGKNTNPKIFELEKDINRWLGKETKLVKNKAGDPIFISKDGTRRVRFDFNRPSPHENPHSHIEIKMDGIWNKSGPIYPKEVLY